MHFPASPLTVRSAGALALILAALALPLRSAEKLPMKENPLLLESTLPFHYPRFDLIKNAHFAPAFEQGMAEHLLEVAAIANNPAQPTFENTIVALERAGELLDRVSTIFYNLTGCNTNDELQAVQKDFAPKLSAHQDAIRLNPALFARIAALEAARDTLGLDAESKRVLWRYHRDFVRAGAKLGAADKERLKQLNTELATLHTAFTQNTLKERGASSVVVDTREELAGLSEAEITAAAASAKKHGKEGSSRSRWKTRRVRRRSPISRIAPRARKSWRPRWRAAAAAAPTTTA
jgi:peptidyl-dipeptidase Dcp